MEKQILESKVLDIIKSVKERTFSEDSWVELKREWPTDRLKAARILAGQANAAQGQPILWVIGLDEEAGVIGAEHAELADWFPQVKKHFDGVWPELQHNLWIPTETGTVVALVFETDRAPYMINFENGPREVPWRVGNSIRSASRRELLGLLSPLQSLPEFEVLSCRMRSEFDNSGRESSMVFDVNMGLYASLQLGQRVVVPFHRCRCWLEIEGILPRSICAEVTLTPPNVRRVYAGYTVLRAITDPPEYDSLTIGATATEAIISGPGAIYLRALFPSRAVVSCPFLGHDARVEVSLGLALIGREVKLVAPLKYSQQNDDGSHTWLRAEDTLLQDGTPGSGQH
ncbi:MAG: hypothetical protein NTY65_03515 [Planctomycetota bacterium]|nr:hypothetical protein [Planctomycetota bacterium]